MRQLLPQTLALAGLYEVSAGFCQSLAKSNQVLNGLRGYKQIWALFKAYLKQYY